MRCESEPLASELDFPRRLEIKQFGRPVLAEPRLHHRRVELAAAKESRNARMVFRAEVRNQPKQGGERSGERPRARLVRRPFLEAVIWLRLGLQSRERNGHHIVVRAGNLRDTDRRGEQPGRIEHRSFLADRHDADDEIPFQGKLAHVAEQMRFARAETAPNEISLGLPTLVETLTAAPKRVEKGIDHNAVPFPQKADGRPVGNPGPQSFNRAARLDGRMIAHHAASVVGCRSECNRTRAASGLSLPAARTSSHTRILSAAYALSDRLGSRPVSASSARTTTRRPWNVSASSMSWRNTSKPSITAAGEYRSPSPRAAFARKT